METGWIDAEGEETEVWNDSDLPTSDLLSSPEIRKLSRELANWREAAMGTRRLKGRGLFDPGKFTVDDNPYSQMRTARAAAADDDAVASTIEVTEGLALQRVTCESPDEHVADIFNQINAQLDLDSHLRIVWRELETYSQSVTATLWGYQSYKSRVRNPSEKRNRDGKQRTYPSRKEYRLYVPTQVVTLDPTKVVPVGNPLFGADRLCWHASLGEDEALDGDGYGALDPVASQLIIGKYTPDSEEKAELAALGVDPGRLWELDPRRVWRTTIGRPAYERFAPVQMRSLFRLLDMKQQLLAADRVALVGNANYILLVRKGDKDSPGKPDEIRHLKENFKVMATLPVIISDHRLSIDIITPAFDNTLDAKRYDLLDRKIVGRLLGEVGSGKGGNSDSSTQTSSRMIARRLESRRLLIKRSWERHVITEIWGNGWNESAFASFHPSVKPSLVYTPRHVQLDNDAAIMSMILTARQAEEISRHTLLEGLGIDQEVEAMRRDLEQSRWPDWQQKVPFNSPANSGGDDSGGEPSQVSGSRGGRPAGGGSSPKSASGQIKKRTTTGAPSTGGPK